MCVCVCLHVCVSYPIQNSTSISYKLFIVLCMLIKCLHTSKTHTIYVNL